MFFLIFSMLLLKPQHYVPGNRNCEARPSVWGFMSSWPGVGLCLTPAGVEGTRGFTFLCCSLQAYLQTQSASCGFFSCKTLFFPRGSGKVWGRRDLQLNLSLSWSCVSGMYSSQPFFFFFLFLLSIHLGKINKLEESWVGETLFPQRG